MRRISIVPVLVASLLLSVLALEPASAGHGPPFGGFEVDGNSPDDSGPGDPVDWGTPPDDLTTFSDVSGAGDDIYTSHSYQNQPGSWTCGNGTTQAHRDLLSGGISFRQAGGEQFVLFNWRRLAAIGDPYVDAEFNQSSAPNPSCPGAPARIAGDVLLTFDLAGNPRVITLRIFRWNGDAVSGAWTRLFATVAATRGHLWDGAISGDGLFGEGSINLTRTLPDLFACRKFASAFLKTRTAALVESQLKDRTQPRPVDLGDCPESELHKSVRNVSEGESFGDPGTAATTPSTTTASPGQLIEYRLTAHNHGDGVASVVIGEEVPDRATVTGCGGDAAPDSGCPVGAGPGTPMMWSLGSVPAGGMRVVTFEVRLDDIFPAGTTVIDNTAAFTARNEPGGSSNETTVVVGAAPVFRVDKVASSNLVTAGDTVVFTVTVRNIGNAPGATPVIDDYDEDHLTVGSISDGGTDDGDTITWGSGTLTPGEPRTFTYQGTFDHVFSSSDPRGDCDQGQFEVANTVRVDGDAATEHVCVIARPALALTKAADEEHVDPGDTLTYTVTYSNDGSGPSIGTVITESVPAGTTFDSCSDACTEAGGTVTWDLGTVEAGSSGSVTLSVSILESAGCEICNLAFIAAASHDVVPSNGGEELCVDATPTPRPAGANASGSAFGAHVEVSLPAIDTTLVPVQSSQSGVGSDADADELLSVSVPADGSVLRATAMGTSSSSAVTDAPPRARQLSVAETANVNIMNGLVTADLVRAVAEAGATGDSSSVSSIGSTFKNLVVNGVAYNDVTPNTTIALPAAIYGMGSYVALYERIASTSGPAPGQTYGGTYEADIEVNMIRVHITGLLGLTNTEVVVSNAIAHADFPQTRLCEGGPERLVSGHAFIASALTDPSLLPVLVGFVSLPSSGGHDHQHYDEAAVPGDGSAATTGTAFTDSVGTVDALATTSSSIAQAETVCVLESGGECLVSADLVLSRSNSAAGPLGAGSNDGETVLANVVVAGTPIAADPGPNAVIELPGGIGYVVLNEQVCDNGASLDAGCADGAGHAGLTVRAIHVVLTGPIGAEVIVAEAHSDATYR